MIEFNIKNTEDSKYTIIFIKIVHKRTGEFAKEPGDTLYNISLDWVKYILANEEASVRFKDEDVSLREYIKEYNKSYKDICELLKKTL